MAVKYQDFYSILGVSRNATADEIHQAYRQLARKYHPDVNKSKDAEDKFKQLGEAYDVLKDPEKRRKFDALGASWKSGQDFKPPPDWMNQFFHQERGGRGSRTTRDETGEPGGDFADFFETFFSGGRTGGSHFHRQHRTAPDEFETFTMEDLLDQDQGESQQAEITIALEEAHRGAMKTLTLQTAVPDERGRLRQVTRTYQVKIPPGTGEGTNIRLAGQGGQGRGGAGDLFLRVHLAPHPHFRVAGHDLSYVLPVTPWEAALGETVTVPTLNGEASLKIPPGTSSGRILRLREKGLRSAQTGVCGDLLVEIRIMVPERLSPEEKRLLEQWAALSRFNPR